MYLSLLLKVSLTECLAQGMEVFILLIQLVILNENRANCLDIIEQDGLLPFLGQAICWSQRHQDIVEGFERSDRTIPHEAIISTVCSKDWPLPESRFSKLWDPSVQSLRNAEDHGISRHSPRQ